MSKSDEIEIEGNNVQGSIEDFDILDECGSYRITLSYNTTSSLVKEAIGEHENYIKDQVLAVEIKPATEKLFKIEELGDSSISFDVSKN